MLTDKIIFPYKNNFVGGYFMSNFHSDYNDIHREIVITDFTDEQIEELLNVLQIKKN